MDIYSTSFGFRYFEFTSDDGFYLNGERVQLNGVCLHHDLGPLGAAVNLSSLRHRMKLLKEMGCNSIRTSHNPPAPEMLDLADEMGFLVIDEAFDEWKYPKCENGYNSLWDEWAEKDMKALIHRDRNHPSVIMWSVGNEIQEQGIEGGANTAGSWWIFAEWKIPPDQQLPGLTSGRMLSGMGLQILLMLRDGTINHNITVLFTTNFLTGRCMASESASTVSSRGEYFFPAEEKSPLYPGAFSLQTHSTWSSLGWATSPDREFAAQDSFRFMAGEYVWTGFDYLGEPTPYNIHWLSRSSYFGIIDLCGIPKDRYLFIPDKWTQRRCFIFCPTGTGIRAELISVHCYTCFDTGRTVPEWQKPWYKEKRPFRTCTPLPACLGRYPL